MVEEKSEKKETKKEESFDKKTAEITNKLRKNPWIVASVVLGVVAIIFLIMLARSGGAISANTAGTNLVDYLNSKVGGGVTLVSVKDSGSLYEVTVNYQSQDIPVYSSKDGKYFIQSAIPITASTDSTSSDNTQTPVNVPKSDKPTAELFVFSYCPYGLQSEKGYIPVYNLLKNKADIKIVFIGAMHGEYEQTESYRQVCIQKNYGKDKLFVYLDKFVVSTPIGACNGDETCSKPLVESIMSQLGINKDTINSCMQNSAKALYDADVARASSLGVSGSPTLVVNGVEVSSGRSASALLASICSGFNNQPSECSQNLSSTSPSAGFGGTGSGTSSSASCG